MKQEEGSRRSFLKKILAGSAVAVGVAAGSKQVKAKVLQDEKKDDVLYRETEQFSRYYDSLRS